MPNIDFYLIPEQTMSERWRFACRLIDKAYSQKHKVYVHVANNEDAQAMNDLLWIFRDVSFVPHDVVGSKNATKSPVVVGFENVPGGHNDILVNLTAEIPEFYVSFTRVIEIVHQDKAWKKIMRMNYKSYKDQGYEINTHDLR